MGMVENQLAVSRVDFLGAALTRHAPPVVPFIRRTFTASYQCRDNTTVLATVSHDCVELFQWAGEHAGDRAFLLRPGMRLRGFGLGVVPDFPAVQQDVVVRAAVLVACFYRAASLQTVLEGCDEC